MMPDGRLKCLWDFEGKMLGAIPDSAKKLMLLQFTNSLDAAISKKVNVRYEVQFIADDGTLEEIQRPAGE